MPENIEKNALVAKGVGSAFLGRLGALIEVAALPLLAGLYGREKLGLFFTLWAAVRVTTMLSEFAMTTTLQRFVPRTESPERALAIFRIAILTSLTLSLVFTAFIMVKAPLLAGIIHAGEADKSHLVAIIRVYAWVLPFWTMVEIATASVRAKRRFGPEIRIRVFYEQGLRFIAAVIFFLIGFESFGLYYAQLLSVAVAAVLSLKLAGRHYDLSRFFKVKADPGLTLDMLSFAALMTPSTLLRKLNSDLPILLLNQLLPGAAGAEAASDYGIGRRIVSTLQAVRQSFEYVVAPYAAFRHAREEHEALAEMYAFSTRLISSLVLPLGVLLIFAADDLLYVFEKEYRLAGGVILILVLGRIVEGMTGPASALIEMIGGRALPLLNGIVGLTTLIALQVWLTPMLGPLGAAVAAAVGLNVTAIMSLIEAWAFFGLQPYRLSLLRPIAVAVGASLIAGMILPKVSLIGPGYSLIVSVAGVFLTVWALVRWGFEARDVAALGRLGKLFSKRQR